MLIPNATSEVAFNLGHQKLPSTDRDGPPTFKTLCASRTENQGLSNKRISQNIPAYWRFKSIPNWGNRKRLLFEKKNQSLSNKRISQTRMHSSRIRTARSSSRLGGSPPGTPPEQPPPGPGNPPGPGTPPDQAPPRTRHPPDQAPPRTRPPCEQNSWHTLVKILPCPKLRLRAVNIPAYWRFKSIPNWGNRKKTTFREKSLNVHTVHHTPLLRGISLFSYPRSRVRLSLFLWNPPTAGLNSNQMSVEFSHCTFY